MEGREDAASAVGSLQPHPLDALNLPSRNDNPAFVTDTALSFGPVSEIQHVFRLYSFGVPFTEWLGTHPAQQFPCLLSYPRTHPTAILLSAYLYDINTTCKGGFYTPLLLSLLLAAILFVRNTNYLRKYL